MLTDILQEAIEEAQNMENEKGFNTALSHGLNIHTRKKQDSIVLTIWRKAKDPSAQEWNTVIAYWPWKLGTLSWENTGVTDSGKHFKQAVIELPQEG